MVDVEVELNLRNKLTKADMSEALRYGALKMINTKHQTFLKIFRDGSVDLNQSKQDTIFKRLVRNITLHVQLIV